MRDFVQKLGEVRGVVRPGVSASKQAYAITILYLQTELGECAVQCQTQTSTATDVPFLQLQQTCAGS